MIHLQIKNNSTNQCFLFIYISLSYWLLFQQYKKKGVYLEKGSIKVLLFADDVILLVSLRCDLQCRLGQFAVEGT